ncbi:thymidine phosphorylase [Candidatus Ruminimicrobiellum ovillum]|uniref:thymidine phosphorylase n=1 Tax=Candidatus Ruminimicrobiellum ovillum TaxID=1947927 RepID=UPI003559B5E4
MRAYDVIYKKRNGQKLSQEEISFMIDGYINREIADYQMSAFLMSVYFQNLDDEETFYLTKAMANSGEILDLSFLDGPTADKHSTGGVGDGTSLLIAPILASCDIYVPMMSGRALGHTGGTLDKLESIPGFNVNLDIKEFISVLKQNKFAMIGQTKEVAPVDKRTYALRDVTATVESIPLICSSIMSKKIAEGAQNILLDVKTGNAAFIQEYEKSKMLAEKMVSVGKKFGRNMTAVITDMDEPLGTAVGNSLEVIQTIEALKNKTDNDFVQLSIDLAAFSILQVGLTKTFEQAQSLAKEKITSGQALNKFIKMIELQKGNTKVVDDYSVFGKAKNVSYIKAKENGYLKFINTRNIGIASCLLGAGRLKVEDKIDFVSGIIIHKKSGDFVNKNDVIFELHHNKTDVDNTVELLNSSYNVSDEKTEQNKKIKYIVN